jgi:S-adenosylmethionine synthetase
MPPAMSIRLFTSESVSEGHPDKVADQISDAILDACLEQDPNSRTAIETLLGLGFAVVTGEIKTKGYVEMRDVARGVIESIGYNDAELGMDGRTCGVLVSVNEQSGDIAMGVDTGGAGDQGMMFGMACDETPELMPIPIALAHAMMRKQAEVKWNKDLGLRPDAKSQITVAYENGKPKYVHTVVCSCQHDPMDQEEVRSRVRQNIIEPVLHEYANAGAIEIGKELISHINPTGAFVSGGPQADSGLTGRKIIVDTYGGMCPHGGGAFSGKDPTKVDRSAAYMCRHVAKCVVAAGLASKVQISVAYAIGVKDPVQITIDTFGTGQIADEDIQTRVQDVFDFSPAGITQHLNLRGASFKYRQTARNGHFGHAQFPWENTDPAEKLKG